MMNNNEYDHLLELKKLIDNNQASSENKRDFMQILYKNENITKEQFESYIKNQNADEIINAALTIGRVLLATWLISKLFEK